MSVTNKHRVPGKQWRRWTASAQRVFNEVYCRMRDSQSMFLHPKASPQTPDHWNTTAWNAAWIAADAADA